jgi:YegS/Rv2252/BmrU family lipid kinase
MALPPIKRVHVIINPAAGQDRPILGTLNGAFQAAGIDWDVFITKKAGDARRLAQEAVTAGADVVAVHGGDGTVMEVASGLIGTEVPLAIFPGGTANVMSVELNIPNNPAEACAIICSDVGTIRAVDMGQVGEQYFLLRAGIGFEAEMVEGADREMKNRVGWLAYALSALQAFREPQIAHYQLTLDGLQVEVEGLTCIIANAGSIGVSGLSLAPTINVSDGLLDVMVVRQANLPSLLSLAASIVAGNEKAEPLLHWQAREITVLSTPPQTVQVDGEILGQTPITAKVLPQAVSIIVPEATSS